MNVNNSIEEKMYTFTVDHLQYYNFPPIKNRLDLNKPVNILELGAYEGRSAIFMLENFCKHKDSRITTVDFELNPQKEILKQNIQICNNNKLKYIEENFFTSLPKLLVEENKYDLIYVDGGKDSKTTIFQIVNCWQLLKENGILYMDDYGWGINPPLEERPKEGIDFFLSLYKDDYELIFQNWQVAIIKK
tara:strand:+ start:13397 stop:13966 length:570 start_codon:yes stop_codon:yes gene_type:complete